MDFDHGSAEYRELLERLKARVRASQGRAALAVNEELVRLYWSIGKDILGRQAALGWGAKVIDHLAEDLGRAFPQMKGFSTRNLKYMRALAEAWPDDAIVQQLVARLPWGHIVRLLDKVKEPAEREFYAREAIAHGWSRTVMLAQIESSLHARQGKVVSNFQRTVPEPRSDLVRQALKDPYVFDFLDLGPSAQERDLERALVRHIRSFLLELGVGFAFVGSQYHLEVGGEDFFIDLLFYHLRLRCFVVVDLKMEAFEPEYAGKMNFYLAAVDDLLRHRDDAPSIGLLLCKGKNRIIVEYALRDTGAPIGVAEWQLTRALPTDLSPNLPTVETLELELVATPDPSLPSTETSASLPIRVPGEEPSKD
jgi:predicted nuclease of restriction endonuclease-like (RecB) superfamily